MTRMMMMTIEDDGDDDDVKVESNPEFNLQAWARFNQAKPNITFLLNEQIFLHTFMMTMMMVMVMINVTNYDPEHKLIRFSPNLDGLDFNVVYIKCCLLVPGYILIMQKVKRFFAPQNLP